MCCCPQYNEDGSPSCCFEHGCKIFWGLFAGLSAVLIITLCVVLIKVAGSYNTSDTDPDPEGFKATMYLTSFDKLINTCSSKELISGFKFVEYASGFAYEMNCTPKNNQITSESSYITVTTPTELLTDITKSISSISEGHSIMCNSGYGIRSFNYVLYSSSIQMEYTCASINGNNCRDLRTTYIPKTESYLTVKDLTNSNLNIIPPTDSKVSYLKGFSLYFLVVDNSLVYYYKYTICDQL